MVPSEITMVLGKII